LHSWKIRKLLTEIMTRKCEGKSSLGNLGMDGIIISK
jgi:hypothetical protein